VTFRAGPYGKPGDAAPVTTLVDQEGKAFSLADLRARRSALTFIFTRCPLPDFCPRMNLNFSEVERLLAADPKLYGKRGSFRSASIPRTNAGGAQGVPRPVPEGRAGRRARALAFRDGHARARQGVRGFFGLTYLKTGGAVRP